MRIVFHGINYSPEPIGIGPYTAQAAESLARRGHEVAVVAAQPYYPQWAIDSAYRGKGVQQRVENGVAVTRTPLYVPPKPSGAKRVTHHLSFGLRSYRSLIRAMKAQPDIVISVVPALLASPAARLAARRAGAATWLHVQDFEVGAAFATGLIDSDGIAARLALGFEKRAMRGFDGYSSISPQMCALLGRVGDAPDRVIEVRNWAEAAVLERPGDPAAYRAEFGVEARHVALYSGNLANKQGIGIIAEVAERLAAREDLLFLVCGDGPGREIIAAAAARLPNLRLEPLQPRERLGDLLALADVHLLPQRGGAADLVLPSKLTNMLASGRPVVATAVPGSGLAIEVEGAGIVTPPEDAEAMATAVERLIDSPAARAESGATARRYALERWSIDENINRLEAGLAAAVARRRRQ
ncbi:WcaI family glycosyltransferase [uncultured Sphingomonas sp.]|uniref:WcaI family glycosyltransferase n=1 Tax=uncultured Sphingomonas sp. TaxID=158754 RepID=UPI0025D02336|nr:WcaI family glycosyltransferase [uncultured Sphingomonas sp.]